MKRYLLSASCGLLLLTVGPSPVLTSLPLQQDTTAKQDANRRILDEKCRKEDRQRDKEGNKEGCGWFRLPKETGNDS